MVRLYPDCPRRIAEAQVLSSDTVGGVDPARSTDDRVAGSLSAAPRHFTEPALLSDVRAFGSAEAPTRRFPSVDHDVLNVGRPPGENERRLETFCTTRIRSGAPRQPNRERAYPSLQPSSTHVDPSWTACGCLIMPCYDRVCQDTVGNSEDLRDAVKPVVQRPDARKVCEASCVRPSLRCRFLRQLV